MNTRIIKSIALTIFLIKVQGCSDLYSTLSCSANTSPVFSDLGVSAGPYSCGPHERCQRVSVGGTDVWVKWPDQKQLVLGVWGFHDKDSTLEVENVSLEIFSKSDPSRMLRRYSNDKWKNGTPVLSLEEKIKENELYVLKFNIVENGEIGVRQFAFKGTLVKGSVETCVALV